VPADDTASKYRDLSESRCAWAPSRRRTAALTRGSKSQR
jgi:hypothetical protein